MKILLTVWCWLFGDAVSNEEGGAGGTGDEAVPPLSSAIVWSRFRFISLTYVHNNIVCMWYVPTHSSIFVVPTSIPKRHTLPWQEIATRVSETRTFESTRKNIGSLISHESHIEYDVVEGNSAKDGSDGLDHGLDPFHRLSFCSTASSISMIENGRLILLQQRGIN